MRAALDTAWIGAHRLRRRLAERRGQAPPPREELVHRHAPGASFADVGCMWNIDGGIAFLAEECGATAVTGLDVMAPTPAYAAEHERRSSAVRFVRGDLHDAETIAQVGPHDVVWCAGVLYHAPNPVLTLERLRSITSRLLILGTATIPEVPGLEGACVFYPALSDAGRDAYARVDSVLRHGISTRFDPGQEYGNWWWGISPSALRGLLEATGFEVIETLDHHFHRTVLARPVAG